MGVAATLPELSEWTLHIQRVSAKKYQMKISLTKLHQKLIELATVAWLIFEMNK